MLLTIRLNLKHVYPWAFSFDPDKEDCKMQLTLELSRLKCYHILDNLTLEAVKDVKIQELHRFVDGVSSNESKAEDATAMLYDFANGIVAGLHVLSGLKGGSGTASCLLGMSGRIAAQADEASNQINVKNLSLGWMIGFLFLVSFVGLFSIVPLRKMMILKYKLTCPSGTATTYLINSFHTPKGAKLAKKQVMMLFYSFCGSFTNALFNGSLLLRMAVDLVTFPPLVSKPLAKGSDELNK
ncbi:putative metal-nicotianamine transporter YSL10 [Camellia lanceoleosa]|uniref:Metal-nicotianamine transporter YSL10 n=1 Tax=Camellia lanceoleosa TaxID=1840588 RepID=A0ACC0FWB5_9ERIC|nr:putative metal-nicotianamine transporter YSL10 [Camellia lanceoleosa]